MDVEAGEENDKGVVVSSGGAVVKFIVGCTESEDDEFNEEWKRACRQYQEVAVVDKFPVDKVGGMRRCAAATSLTSDRKRLQSECSSGVSTRFSCSEGTRSTSNCSMASDELSSEDEDESMCGSIGTNSLQKGVDKDMQKVKIASMDMTTVTSTTNEGYVAVCHPLPLTKRLVVNPVPSVEIVWTYDVVDGLLVAKAPASIQKACGITDALVTLLEYGENELHCSRAVILVERDSQEKDSLLRMFSFLGFLQVEPQAAPACLRPYAKQYVLLITDFAELQEDDSDQDMM
jgi:hypothetical protein